MCVVMFRTLTGTSDNPTDTRFARRVAITRSQEPMSPYAVGMGDTQDQEYTRRLQLKGDAAWKRILNVQAPYRWNLRRQHLGRTLDVGCGIGRNLSYLDPGSVGVDHNPTSVDLARRAGLTALTTTEWESSPHNREAAFDGLLLAHVVEHMDYATALALVKEYVPALKPGGKAFFICPQERGYKSDHTHVAWTTGETLETLAREAGLIPQGWHSFPFPRRAGRIFTYNEFTLLATKPI